MGKKTTVITIKVNERNRRIPLETKLMELKGKSYPSADLIIYNGFPTSEDIPLKPGDEVVFIEKGKAPDQRELECLMVARHTPGVHRRVKKSTVGVAGLGGLGSQVAIALARLGIGTLVLADYDIVEPSNLNRQQYYVRQIGMPKVDAMRENLKEINPYVLVITHHTVIHPENVREIFGNAHVIVEAFDRADQKALLINAVSQQMPDTYIVAASGVAGYDDSNAIKTTNFSSKIFIVGDQRTAAGPGVGLMAPRVGIAAHHQANMVLRLILGEEGYGSPP